MPLQKAASAGRVFCARPRYVAAGSEVTRRQMARRRSGRRPRFVSPQSEGEGVDQPPANFVDRLLLEAGRKSGSAAYSQRRSGVVCVIVCFP